MPPGTPPAAFLTTRWSLVVRAAEAQADGDGVNAALESLCRTYWHPLYCWLRRSGHSPEEAEDLTQEMFSHLMSRPVM